MDDDSGSQDARDEPAHRARGDWKQTLSTGVLLGGVLSVLAAGGLLRADRTASPLPQGEHEARPASATVAAPTDSEAATRGAPPSAFDAPARPAASPSRAATPVPALPPAEPSAPPRGGTPAPPAPGGDLEQRAQRDLARIARGRGSYTAQVLVTCKPDNTGRILQKAGGSDRLFLLPLSDRGPSCYRVCWGLYPTSKEAAAASDLPAFLLQGGGRPSPKAVRDLAP